MTTEKKGIGIPKKIELSDEDKRLIRETVVPDDLKNDEKAIQLFFHRAETLGLDPMAQQIRLLARPQKVGGQWQSKGSVEVGIDGFRMVAHHTGQFSGYETKSHYDQNGKLASVTVSIWRKDWDHPVKVTAHLSEYGQTDRNGNLTRMWAKMPHVMLEKVAEARALRIAFPQLSGVYEHAEMDQTANDASNSEPPKSQNQESQRNSQPTTPEPNNQASSQGSQQSPEPPAEEGNNGKAQPNTVKLVVSEAVVGSTKSGMPIAKFADGEKAVYILDPKGTKLFETPCEFEGKTVEAVVDDSSGLPIAVDWKVVA